MQVLLNAASHLEVKAYVDEDAKRAAVVTCPVQVSAARCNILSDYPRL